MKTLRKFLVIIAAIWTFSFAAASLLTAQNSDDKRYEPIYQEPSPDSTAKNIGKHFLVYPFELIRWPIDQGLYIVEKYRIDKKVKWVYDEILEKGITPYGNVIGMSNMGGGLNVDWVTLAKQRADFPHVVVKNWIEWNNHVNFETGAQIGLERIMDTGFRTLGTFKYENRPEEHFYGIGHHSSAGDGSSYRMEATHLEYKIGYNPSPTFSGDAKFAYQNVNITNGEDGGRNIIDTQFTPGSIDGLAGDEIITIGGEMKHDTRNRGTSSFKGGQQRIAFSYNNGVAGSDARYLKYEAEITHFFRMWSDRRVVAIHLYAEENNEIDHRFVPFHQMAKLGGYGLHPRISETLRGFDFNRFFDKSAVVGNLEYRYTIWEHKDFKLDTVIFVDEGQVLEKVSRMKFKDFRESYGGGVRFSVANNVILAAEIAHGDEGTNVYVKSGAPF